jgi:rod shape-determining protein MreD
MMPESSQRRSSYGVRAILPFAFSILAAVVSNISLGLQDLPNAAPFLTLIVVFFWISRRPKLLPPIVLFVVGLWHDAVTGAPMGLTSLLLLAARAAVVEQNIFVFSQSFLLGWIGFSVLCLAVVLLKLLLASWMYGGILSIEPFFVQLLLSIIAYPVVGALCGWIDQIVYLNRRG